MLQKVHFRLTSVPQKRCCLSSLITPLRRSEIMLKLDPASRHLSNTKISENASSVRNTSLYEGLKISQTPFHV